MKTKVGLFVLIMLILPFTFLFAGCDENVKYNINFIVDEQVYATVESNGNEYLRFPDNPSKDGYDFVGWFLDKDTWEVQFKSNTYENSKITRNINVFAYFERDEQEIHIGQCIYNVNIGENFVLDIVKNNLKPGTKIYLEVQNPSIITRTGGGEFDFVALASGSTIIMVTSNLESFIPQSIIVTVR